MKKNYFYPFIIFIFLCYSPSSFAEIVVISNPLSGIENITEEIQNGLTASQLRNGIVTLFVQHTTASVLIIEDEPGLRADTKTIWNRLIPADPNWNHNTYNPGEDNGHSHLCGQLQGSSITIPFTQSRLTLGTWQQIILIDFDPLHLLFAQKHIKLLLILHLRFLGGCQSYCLIHSIDFYKLNLFSCDTIPKVELI